MSAFHDVSLGLERCDEAPLPRHRHAQPYLTLVLGGGYVEAGDAGRLEAAPGRLLVHAAFEAHLDRFARGGATVLNLPMRADTVPAASLLALDDPDEAVRLARCEGSEAASIWALARARPVAPRAGDWPEHLALALADPGFDGVGAWADRHGLALSAVSRGFRQVFGTSPKRYRLEARTRRAWRALADDAPLAGIALATGFADQAHMTRSIAALTGLAPRQWRQLRSRRGAPQPR